MAGASPNKSEHVRVIPTAKTTSFVSHDKSRESWLSGQESAQSSAWLPQRSTRSPNAAPASESARLSVSSWRTRRQRVAPSASRVAISPCRFVARASSKFPRFAHAMISPTTDMLIRSSTTSISCNHVSALPLRGVAISCGGAPDLCPLTPLALGDNVRDISALRTRNPALAWLALSLGRSLPMMLNNVASGSSSDGV